MNQISLTSTKAGPLPHKLERHIELPSFEKTAAEIRETGKNLIALSKASIEKLKSLKDSEIQFETSLGFLDDLEHYESKVLSRIFFLQNVHPDAEVREAAREVSIEFQKWGIEKIYDEGVYRIVKAYANKGEKLEAEDKKYLDELMRDYRRLGMELDSESKTRLQNLKKLLSEKETQFSSNIQEYSDYIAVEPERLKGLDASFIAGLQKLEDGRLKISLDYPEYFPVMEHAEDEDLRRELLIKKYKAAQDVNSKLLQEIVSIRKEIAKILGYKSWNHYVIEERMAKEPERVKSFLLELQQKLQPKAKKEIELLGQLKKKLKNQKDSKLEIWDYYYLSSLLKKESYSIDSQEIKKYFPLSQVIPGMFEIFERLFGIRMEELKSADFYQWHPEVRAFRVLDEMNEIVGHFYLDLHPRPGKYNHAAAFSLISGKYLPNGKYQAPVSAMVCNFPRPSASTPALIPHHEVETLFHEFGHILHGILTQAKYYRFSGTSVARDFVEAPSQVLENWVWDKQSLDLIARHWETGENLPENLIERMKAAKQSGIALFYLRQISLALADLEIHGEDSEDPIEVSNRIMAQVFMAPPEDTAFAASWGHMVGYASGYYGYAWADVMAADLFSKFKAEGILNSELGRKLKKEIYQSGASRDENLSLEAFLGRSASSAAFFEDLGVSPHV